ncbi:MAG: prepilin-type N-terminal cleavage/methylation domain-containing protein [Gemmataceae bacterium]
MNTRRSAFTLLELMIVLVIFVLAAGIVVISMRSAQGPYRLSAATDAVRGAWATARSRAIEEGRPYRFAVEPGGRHFRVAPDVESYWAGGNGNGAVDDPDGPGTVLVNRLPPGVRFLINGQPGQLPPMEEPVAAAQAPPSGQWDAVCVFLPDGTSRQDVRIVFQVVGAAPMELLLRGLTGTSTVQRLR